MFCLICHSVFILVVFEYFTFTTCSNNDNSFAHCQNTLCNPSNAETIIKNEKSQFEQCPTTTKFCIEQYSKIYLNDSRLFLDNYGALDIRQYSKFILTRNGICKIFDRGFIDIENGIITIENGRLTLADSGEIFNKGSIYIGDNSMLHITSHTKVLTVDGFKAIGPGSLHIDKSSNASFERYSTVNLYKSSELRANENNLLNVNDHCDVQLDFGSIFMKRNSKLELLSFSKLNVGEMSCHRKVNETKFTFGVGSELFLYGQSDITLRSGQIVLDDHAIFSVSQKSHVYVQGLLQITKKLSTKDVSVRFGKSIVVGEHSTRRMDEDRYCKTDASLIILTDTFLPNSLVIRQGAHCFTKTTGNYSHEFSKNANVDLEEDAETDQFKCFKTRNELMDAIKRI